MSKSKKHKSKKQSNKESSVGRPTKMTPEIIGKLETSFSNGYTDVQACVMANINPSTLYEYCKENPEFSEKKEELKKRVDIQAKLNIVKSLQAGDKDISKWWLERKCKEEFSLRTEHTGKNGEDIKQKVIYIDKEEKGSYEKHIDDAINAD